MAELEFIHLKYVPSRGLRYSQRIRGTEEESLDETEEIGKKISLKH